MEPFDILSAIEACYCAQLALGPNPPSQCCMLASGEPVIADCCAGFAWVRLISIYPSAQFPAFTQVPDRCLPPVWAMRIELGIARCAPDNCGEPAANACCEQELVAVAQQILDRDAMVKTLMCCLPGSDPDAPRMDEIIPGEWSVTPSEGGCFGSTMQATIRILNSCAC